MLNLDYLYRESGDRILIRLPVNSFFWAVPVKWSDPLMILETIVETKQKYGSKRVVDIGEKTDFKSTLENLLRMMKYPIMMEKKTAHLRKYCGIMSIMLNFNFILIYVIKANWKLKSIKITFFDGFSESDNQNRKEKIVAKMLRDISFSLNK